MRVLCIGTDYPPSAHGGYELQCAGFVDHLRRHGHDVAVLTGEGAGECEDAHVARTLPRFPVDPRAVSLRAAWRAERRAAAALRSALRRRPDVVCFWRLGELSMSLVARVRSAGLPAVGMVCDPWMLEGPRRDPWCRGRRPRFEGAAEWIFVSHGLRRAVTAAGVAIGQAQVVPWGVELDRFGMGPERAWGDRLLYVGRLSPLKGVDLAIAALARLPSARLDVVGGGAAEQASALRDLAASLGVSSRVRFHGPRSRQAVAAAYGGADALLFPVRWEEPFGAVPLEALASGTPVVATAGGGTAEYLEDGRNALIVPRDDPGALAGAVVRLRDDAHLRNRLRRAGRRTAERYPAELSHQRVREALEAAAQRRKAISCSA